MNPQEPTLLFDAPGPRARRRERVLSVVVGLLLAALLAVAVHRFAERGQLDAAKWQPFTAWATWRFLLNGAWYSLLAATGAAAIAGPLGLALAVGRMSDHRAVRWAAGSYVEIMRTVPVLLLIYVTLFALPQYGVNLSLYWKLVAPLALSTAASTAEIFRAGLLSLDRGQREAGLSIGLTPGRTMLLILLPQALRRVVPSLVSQSVGLIKDTSLGYIVSYYELLFSGQVYATYSHLLIQTFLTVAAIYLVVNGSLSKLGRVLQQRDRTTRPRPRRRTPSPLAAHTHTHTLAEAVAPRALPGDNQ
ncbi:MULTISPECIES: amino acid ABC transporter permease [unclassified Streptomyces]|uniref:amino acid ABC transporter permease n=1 Tax=unclassified Streptomyces TaxID=2593676 RepID=UPI001F03795B|nr:MULTISPECIES: amino acid ABC transporter permease [unclassified Streptomyces]MCH0564846.1 amino acid ABC transporter permease [Streptomyces sp. MUM 2J]MCH0569880.1 amino acid ABC transporter permease [Streptomyces sp. MUM 136J]